MTQDTIKPLIDRLEELDAKRAPGEWSYTADQFILSAEKQIAFVKETNPSNRRQWRDTARFICILANKAPSALRSAQAEIDRLQAAIREKGGTEHAPTQWAYDKACEVMHKMRAEKETAQAREAELVERYNELIMEVVSKYPGETRHETARRLIREKQNYAEPEAAAEKS